MNARRDASDEPTRGSVGGRVLLSAAVVFALGATAVLILSEELKWLRLGIVAALWAALAGAFLAARYRRQVADHEEAAVDRQERYELELEREIAARREYELEVAAEAKRKAEEDARDDIAALRQELSGLRQTLESLLGGEFLVERYALRAESTRMRSLPDDRSLKRLPPAQPREETVIQEAQTDLIERVQEFHQPRKRTVEPLPRRSARPDFPLPEPAEPVRVEHPAEVSDRWFVPDGLGTEQPAQAESQPYAARQYVQRTRNAQPQQPNRHTVASGYMEPVSRPRAHQPKRDTSGYAAPPTHAESSGYGQPVARPDTPGYALPTTRAESSGYGQPARPDSSGYAVPTTRAESSKHGQSARPDTSGYAVPTTRAESSGYGQPVRPDSSGYAVPTTRAESSGYGQPARPDSSGYAAPTTRAESSGYSAPANRGGHAVPTHSAESSGYSAPTNRGGYAESSGGEQTPDTGGRRRRAEGQPTWQEAHGNSTEAGPTGSHAAGRSVSELLASHGNANSPNTPRRRRRRAD